jgi:hypothetical protein
MKNLLILARQLKKKIGADYRYTSAAKWPKYNQDTYLELRRDSDEAVSLAKYLIQHLDNRHQAVTFANAVGMPGYINNR